MYRVVQSVLEVGVERSLLWYASLDGSDVHLYLRQYTVTSITRPIHLIMFITRELCYLICVQSERVPCAHSKADFVWIQNIRSRSLTALSEGYVRADHESKYCQISNCLLLDIVPSIDRNEKCRRYSTLRVSCWLSCFLYVHLPIFILKFLP